MGASRAVTADAFHTLTDVSTDLAIILGVRWWMSPPDRCHPYGHQRIEAIVTLFVGAVLCLGAVWLAADGISGLRESRHAAPRIIALIAAVISIVTKEVMYRLTVIAGRKIKSHALLANAWHHRSDAFSSIPAAIAVAVAMLKPEWGFIDHVGELLVAVIIVRTAYKIMRSAVAELSDGTASPKDHEDIEAIVRSVKGVRDVHAVRSRRLGPGLYVDLHVLVDGESTVRRGHDIAEEVKIMLLRDGPDVADTVVHVEPHDVKRPDSFE